MCSIAEMPNQTGAPVAGIYRVVAIRPGQARHDGRPSIRVWIADASAVRLCGGYQAEIGLGADQVERGALVAIRGHVERTSRHNIYIRLSSCRPVTVADRPSWQLLPRTWVPAGAEVAFERLLQLLDRLAPLPLRNFMERVLADPA
ncbi:hypothetical protein ACS8YF_17690 [Salinisphaera sp. SWV1]|uniref:hypothetical protein n=1 Tax=Salinisphaera sp. SWV1 TaxID=3454139 RepID=UPI003F86D523